MSSILLVHFVFLPIFRAENISHAWDYIARICSPALFEPVVWPDSWFETAFIHSLIGIVLLQTVEWAQRSKQHGLQFDRGGEGLRFTAIRFGIYYLLLIAIYLMFAQQQAFIYFQF